MVNLKTKGEKHANDNEKRRKSLKEKEKAKLNQSQIIKQALSSSTLRDGSSKKIIFSDEDEEPRNVSNSGEVAVNNSKKDLSRNGKSVLFDSSDSENENFEIKEKSQFSGKKGFELLNLQSTYGNDERFKIDERFLEDEKLEFKDDDPNLPNDNEGDAATEKAKQLRILESVLETPVTGPVNEKKAKKRTYEMVRYDASNKDHEIYEIKPQSVTAKPTKKRRDERRTSKANKEDLPKPEVSKEKFYEVSNEIKSRFKEKKEESGQFSLLQTYGLNGNEENVEIEEEYNGEEEEEDIEDFTNEENFEGKTEHKIEEREEKEVTELSKEENGVVAKGIWKEPFFFVEDDPRYKEAVEFINKKHSAEAAEAAEKYDQTRRQIREVLRLHLKKQMHKKDPFKTKVGGMNKKQLANLKYKTLGGTFNKRNPPKMNPRRRT